MNIQTNNLIFNFGKNPQTLLVTKKCQLLKSSIWDFVSFSLPCASLQNFGFFLNCAFTKNFPPFFPQSMEGRALKMFLLYKKWNSKMLQDDSYNHAFSPFFFVAKSCPVNISIPISQLQWSSGKSGTFGYAQHHK